MVSVARPAAPTTSGSIAPAIMIAFGAVLWTRGFGPEDRELFRMNKADVRGLREAEEAAEARDQIGDNII